MARRTPFPFADHHDPEVLPGQLNELIPGYIQAYEEALLTEYKSGDIDVASYHEGLRQAYETVLVDLLGIDQAEMDAYWDRGQAPAPAPGELPHPPGDPLITYEQVEQWAGYRLNADEWERLADAIPNSSIPEAIDTLVAVIAQSEEG